MQNTTRHGVVVDVIGTPQWEAAMGRNPWLAPALNAAGLSLFYPGAGQAMQGRVAAASWQFAEFTVLVLAGALDAEQRWMWFGFAALVGLYSIVDAFRYERNGSARTAT